MAKSKPLRDVDYDLVVSELIAGVLSIAKIMRLTGASRGQVKRIASENAHLISCRNDKPTKLIENATERNNFGPTIIWEMPRDVFLDEAFVNASLSSIGAWVLLKMHTAAGELLETKRAMQIINRRDPNAFSQMNKDGLLLPEYGQRLGSFLEFQPVVRLRKSRIKVHRTRDIADLADKIASPKYSWTSGDFTQLQWQDLLQREGYRCAYCRNKFTVDKLCIEHMTPRSRGGEHTLSNIAPACRRCNNRKRSKTPLEYIQYLMRSERLKRPKPGK